MKALRMSMAKGLKVRSHFLFCLRCGHANNGEDELFKRICQCAVPVLCSRELIGTMPLHELRRLPQFHQHFETKKED